jgi:hypothetical protein
LIAPRHSTKLTVFDRNDKMIAMAAVEILPPLTGLGGFVWLWFYKDVAPALRMRGVAAKETGEDCHNLFEVGDSFPRFPKVEPGTVQPLGFGSQSLRD